MRYYIYLKACSHKYYTNKNKETESYTSNWNEFALSKNEGKQCEKGHICGGANWYGFENCEIIGESRIIYNFEETEEETFCNCKYIVEKIEPTIKNIEDGAAWKYAQVIKKWHTFEADNDDKAFEKFNIFCLENIETDMNIKD